MHPADPVALGLPHRAPFVFIDSVSELEAGRMAVCTKFFGANEPFFAGHFPGNPLVPGVLLAEAMAQTAGLAAGKPGTTFHLSAIKQMKFLKPVPPDTEVVFRAEKNGEAGALVQFQTTAQVAGETVAEGMIVLAAA